MVHSQHKNTCDVNEGATAHHQEDVDTEKRHGVGNFGQKGHRHLHQHHEGEKTRDTETCSIILQSYNGL